MPNPWLNIPLEEYEGHMSAPQVAQLQALAELFEVPLRKCRPRSVAVLGIAGRNGLNRIDPAVTDRIVGVDINPAYLEAVRKRFPANRPLTLHCLDLSTETVREAPVTLVHAALIFEHAGTGRCLENSLSLVEPRGYLCVVLQIPSTEEAPDVTPSPYAAMQALGGHIHRVEPGHLRQEIELHEFKLQHQEHRTLPAGKEFWLGIFRRLA